MLSMSPEEPLDEKNIFIRQNYSFVNVGDWAHILWLLSENSVRVFKTAFNVPYGTFREKV